MAATAQRHEVAQIIRFAPRIEGAKRFDVVNVEPQLLRSLSTTLATLPVSLACQFSLLTPVRAVVMGMTTPPRGIVFGVVPNPVIPAIDRAIEYRVKIATVSGYGKRLLASLTNLLNRPAFPIRVTLTGIASGFTGFAYPRPLNLAFRFTSFVLVDRITTVALNAPFVFAPAPRRSWPDMNQRAAAAFAGALNRLFAANVGTGTRTPSRREIPNLVGLAIERHAALFARSILPLLSALCRACIRTEALLMPFQWGVAALTVALMCRVHNKLIITCSKYYCHAD